MKKKVRVIQYGVGPIGAALVRLMREKQALQLAGAIGTLTPLRLAAIWAR